MTYHRHDEQIDPESLWFNTPDTNTLCRAGGNGENHPSQLYALKKYWNPLSMSILDYGAGSATTFEAISKQWPEVPVRYLGLDIIPKNVAWCQGNFPKGRFEVNKPLHRIDQLDQSWDLVYSRHVIDHMESFEEGLDEHCRVAKDLVIVVGWVPFASGEQHEIKNIVDQGKVYTNEYTNSFSEALVMQKIHSKIHEGWQLKELSYDVGAEVKGHDWVLVMQRR